jgi:hypothetical protein
MMRRHNISLSEPLSNKIKAQARKGRFKDFSAAIQEAAWKHFGEPSIFVAPLWTLEVCRVKATGTTRMAGTTPVLLRFHVKGLPALLLSES